MKLIVGLGNPGDKYRNNRHNTGFLILDNFVDQHTLGGWSPDKNLKTEIIKKPTYIFAKPQTFMNNSGESVSKILSFYKIKPDDLVVIHDDVDLPFPCFKLQYERGAAGHHGVESIINSIGTTKFHRLRVGVGRPANPHVKVDDYVLSDYTGEELSTLLRQSEICMSELINSSN